MSPAASLKPIANPHVTLEKADTNKPAFGVTEDGQNAVIMAGTTVSSDEFMRIFHADQTVLCADLVAGTDYRIFVDIVGAPIAVPYEVDGPEGAILIGGFHYAPGGNATAREGGDTVPAINPHSCWDVMFRPACADTRGMALVTHNQRGEAITPFWADIYLLNVNHIENGTSRAGAQIADGWSPPVKCDGEGHYKGLNWETAKEILAHHGKAMLSDEDFRAAAFGVTEAKSRRGEPERAGFDDPERDAPFTSRWGLIQATGCMWVHGTDGDPDIPRYTILGGDWGNGSSAGSRASFWNSYPWNSSDGIGARGRSDHLTLG